jgi:hypothetical protein
MGPQGSSQVSSSHSTTPKANKSLAAVGRSPRSTSGACGSRAEGKGRGVVEGRCLTEECWEVVGSSAGQQQL